MAELAALGVAASIIQVIDISVRVAERLNEYREKGDSLPDAFKHVSTRLPIFVLALRNTNAKIEDMTDDARKALKPAIEECFSQIKKLETIIDKVLFKPGDGGATRGWKSIKSVKHDSDVSALDMVIRRYMEAMHYALSSVAPPLGNEKSSPQPTSTCPFELEADFVERDVMNDVTTRCQPGSRSALIGIGGAGKSRIAIEYSYRVRKAAPDTWVFWVTFDTPAAVAQDFRKIAKAVGLRGWDEKAADVFTMVRDWLKDESNGPWILILDNVDSVDVLTAPVPKVASSTSVDDASPMPQIRNFITTSTKGSVLVTSRNTEAAQMITGNCAYHIDVDEMNEFEAIALLKKKLSSKVIYTEAEAAELVKAVDFMPLAISQIATNISMNYPRLTLSKATERIQAPSEETVQLLETSAHETSRDTNRTNSIVKTWHLSFQYVRETYPSAARLLSLMCLFGRQGIPESLLTGQYGEEATVSVTPLQPRLNWWKRIRRRRLYLRWRQRTAQQRATGDKTNISACFDEDWRVLTNFALIKTNVDGCHFSMHRLVQYTTKRWLEINGELKAWMQRYVSIFRICFPKPEYDNWKLCQYLFPHAQQTANYRPEDRVLLLKWALLIEKISLFAHVVGDYSSAEDLGRTALAALKMVQGPHCEDTLRSYHQLGLTIMVFNRHNESEKLFRRAYEGRLALLGPDHLDTLDSANNLGTQLNFQGKYEEGEAIHMRMIDEYERVYGPRSAEIQSLMAGRVFGYMLDERFEQATAILRRLLAIKKENSGEGADIPYDSLIMLGNLLNMQGKAAEAEEIHRQVVEYMSKRRGPDHSDTIQSVNFLCKALVKQDKLDEAVAHYRSITDMYTELDEKAQQEALLAMNSLAETLAQQGHLEQAEAICRRLVLESERLLGADHYDTLVGIHTLANIFNKQKRYEEALELYERAYIGTEKRCGANHPDTKEFLEDFNHAKRNIPV